MISLSFVLSFMAFMHFALCINSHYKDLYKCSIESGDSRILQSLAWGLLLASAYPCLIVWGGEIGVTTWLCMITLSALAVTLLLSYARPAFFSIWRRVPGGLICLRRQSKSIREDS